ncbi:MAG: hypothetical protein ACFFDI_26455 [Promethearchaeota archaeon]
MGDIGGFEIMYPYREDYKCPDCETGTMKWEGQLFASTYVLGRYFCDNPECINHRDNWLNLDFLKEYYKNYETNG